MERAVVIQDEKEVSIITGHVVPHLIIAKLRENGMIGRYEILIEGWNELTGKWFCHYIIKVADGRIISTHSI